MIKTLQVGVLGCGRVAEHHLRFIRQTEGAVLAGIADVQEASARRLGETYGIQNVHTSLESLLASTKLDVIHILTPPACHYAQAKLALEHAVNLLIEKPFTLSAVDTRDLYDRASQKGVSICPDFILLFHPRVRRAMELIEQEGLGRVIHYECYLTMEQNAPELREAKGLHWVYELPGGQMHDSLTHLLYLALHWTGKPKRVLAIPKCFGTLPQGLTDHLNIEVDGERASGHITLSYVTGPRYYYIRLFCENGTVLVNFHTMTVAVERRHRLPAGVDRALSNFRMAYQLSRGTVGTILDTLRGRLVPYQGLQTLVPDFYRSIRTGGPPPVSPELTVWVSEAEDAVVAQGGKLRIDLNRFRSMLPREKRSPRALVTGASGYIGTEVARQLVQNGYAVRALVRPLARTETLEQLGAEIIYGDVREKVDLSNVAENVDVIVHLAAGLRGTRDFILESSVNGTQNVADAARAGGVKRVIYISSFSVYDYYALSNGDTITEATPLEPHPELRGFATLGKRRAEEIALAHLADTECPWTILRPSLVMGNGRDLLTPLGSMLGNWVISLCSRRKRLLLIHVKDLASAVLRMIQTPETAGKVFNVSELNAITVRQYVKECVRKIHYKNVRVVCVPYWVACCGVLALKILYGVRGKGPRLHLRQMAAVYRNLKVDTSAIRKQTGWEEHEPLSEHLARARPRTGGLKIS